MKKIFISKNASTWLKATVFSLVCITTVAGVGSTTTAFIECCDSPFYNGDGIEGGVELAEQISGISDKSIREVVRDILITVLSFLGLLAVVMIVIAGIMMVVSGGDEQLIARAKKIIFWTIIGLLVILFATAIVVFFGQEVPNAVNS